MASGDARAPTLITPHGDWKQPGGPHRVASAHLITPHGDWKPDAIDKLITLKLNSLPLMGIGNSWGARVGVKSNRPSLPLMGIGNQEFHAGHSRVVTSLPLMGIGNKKHLSVGLRLEVLITPHGDWKRNA